MYDSSRPIDTGNITCNNDRNINVNVNVNATANANAATAATANANVLLATMPVLTIPANLMGMTLAKQINTFDPNRITNSNLNISSHMIHSFNKHDNFMYSIFPIQNQLNNINPVTSIHSMSIGAWVYVCVLLYIPYFSFLCFFYEIFFDNFFFFFSLGLDETGRACDDFGHPFDPSFQQLCQLNQANGINPKLISLCPQPHDQRGLFCFSTEARE
ncbi:hypothetical protein RFI_29583, partial [Reticulomyxa filosa]